MAVVGTAYIAVKMQQDGSLEATLVKDVEAAAKQAESAAVISPIVDTKKATGPLDLLKSKLTGFAGSGSPVTKALGDIEVASGGAEGAMAGLATGGIAIAGAAAVAFAAKSVSAFQDYAGGVRAVQRVTGATAEDSSKLAAAFRAVGIAPDQAAPSLGRFARNLDTNAAALGKLGIEVTKNKDGTTNMVQTFLNVADATQKAKDPTEKLNIAMTAFGRSGQQLLPILMKGKDGITELFGEAGKHGQLFSQKDLDTSKDLSFAMRGLKETFNAVFLEAGKLIAPVILDIANIVSGVIELSQKFTIVKDIIKVALMVAFAPLIAIVKAIDLLSKAVDFLTGRHHDHKDAAKADASATDDLTDSTTDLAGAADAATKAVEAQKKADEEHAKTVKDLDSAIRGVTSAQHDLKDANTQVTTSRQQASEAQQKLSDLEKAGTINTQDLATAQQDLAQAQKANTDAIDKVKDATKSVNDANQARLDALDKQAQAQQRVNDLISGQAALEDMAAHKHDLEHATLNVRNAQASLAAAQKDAAAAANKVADAEKKLADLRAGHTATASDIATAQQAVSDAQASQADDVAAAQLRVDEATLSLTESQENLTDTQKSLNDIQHEGETGSKTLAAAQKDLATANKGVQDASDQLTKSQKDLTAANTDVTTTAQAIIDKQAAVDKAMQPDPKLVEAIKNARKDVKDANQGVADAESNASEKAYALATAQQTLNTQAGNSLGNLRNVKSNLQDIVNLQPQAAAFLGPTLDMVNTLIQAATDAVSIPGLITVNNQGGSGGAYRRKSGPQEFAAGGFATGDFVAGERGAELISLRPGGGAMVYAAGSPEAAGGSGMPPVSINISANFGAGTNAADVVTAMRSVAQNEIAQALKQVVSKINAGARR